MPAKNFGKTRHENKEMRRDRSAVAVSQRKILCSKERLIKNFEHMHAAEREIRDAEAALAAAKRRKIELKLLSNCDAERHGNVSGAIISSMFGR